MPHFELARGSPPDTEWIQFAWQAPTYNRAVSAPYSEFELIDRHFRRVPRDPAVRVGIGDDGAVIAPTPGTELVVSVDMLVEGRHFFPEPTLHTLATRHWR